jgi:hypothetical protein
MDKQGGGNMAKHKKKCATCGKDLTNKNYHLMWDDKQEKSIPVCRDGRQCQRPYVAKLA